VFTRLSSCQLWSYLSSEHLDYHSNSGVFKVIGVQPKELGFPITLERELASIVCPLREKNILYRTLI